MLAQIGEHLIMRRCVAVLVDLKLRTPWPGKPTAVGRRTTRLRAPCRLDAGLRPPWFYFAYKHRACSTMRAGET
jgi:hypothetical protein